MQDIAVFEGNVVEFKKVFIDTNINFEVGDTAVIDKIELNTSSTTTGIEITLLTGEILVDNKVRDYNDYLKRLFKVKVKRKKC